MSEDRIKHISKHFIQQKRNYQRVGEAYSRRQACIFFLKNRGTYPRIYKKEFGGFCTALGTNKQFSGV